MAAEICSDSNEVGGEWKKSHGEEREGEKAGKSVRATNARSQAVVEAYSPKGVRERQ